MSRIIEEICMEESLCTATIYLEFANQKLALCKKTTSDGFKTVDVELPNDVYDYAINHNLNGYTVYALLSNVREAVKDGNYNKMYRMVKDFNKIERDVKTDLVMEGNSSVKVEWKNPYNYNVETVLFDYIGG